ncbi:MAG: hypothetical protein K9H48_17575 [Melioribacteraceae bacterium]|nr:hypothetical protein [Melioribacteraceae bacterium]MCF8395714.1 hypothetical protein [Melioribacteraceae bacterium]MCF8421214.1 hypothetical protein [Melioribacteraceae bacterium]
MKKLTLRKYTPALKEKVLKELEDGTLSSYEEAKRKYKIKGKMTVKRWIEKAGKKHLLHRVKVIG